MDIEAAKVHTNSAKDNLKDVKDEKAKDANAELGKALGSLKMKNCSKPDPLALFLFVLLLIGLAATL